ncbi:MAG TPA: amidohydrolase family protein [Candidatus Limnocylindrales bacterium]|jgi:N-acyl-D-aspartate/D-glutamate deacylase|nr:amidohydrolase family protein [Candidatus Limnocylindrales bacterium]
MTFDTVIRGGRLVDGTGLPSRMADVALVDGRIAAIVDPGHFGDAVARTFVDADGLVVAPGFVDIHNHGDVTVVADPRARSAIAQGVTTIVVGNCGQSPAPLPIPETLPDLAFGRVDPSVISWETFDGYLDAVDAARPAVNVASLAGHNAIRVAVLGRSARAGTSSDQRAMVAELDRAVEAGAFGLSLGLEYPLGAGSQTDELVTMAEAVARHDGLFAIHTRDRDFAAVEAFDEAFGIAERTGVALQISHIAPRRGAPDGALEDVLTRIDRSRSAGLDVACDQHTRQHGITKLVAMLPPTASAGGPDELLRQLRDPSTRASFHAFRNPIHKLGLLGEWDRLALFEAPASPEWVGKDFATIGKERGEHPLDAMMDILIEAGDDASSVMFVGLVQTERDLDLTFASPTCVPESDATVLALDGPLADQRFLGAYTWAAFYLRCIVRERQVLGLEEGIHRLTGMPARRLGLTDRGVLTPGAWGDVAIFDPDLVEDLGTVADPNRFPRGIRHVLVNGEVAFDDGWFTAGRAGRVLRRPGLGVAS